MSEGEKISLISKYTVIGATKKQIIGIFLLTGADSASACSFIYEPPVFATSIVEYSGSSEMRFIRPFTSAPSLLR